MSRLRRIHAITLTTTIALAPRRIEACFILFPIGLALWAFHNLDSILFRMLGTPDTADNVNASSGRLRLARSGSTLTYLYNITGEWVQLASTAVPTSDSRTYFEIHSVSVEHIFSTFFDNFTINSGEARP